MQSCSAAVDMCCSHTVKHMVGESFAAAGHAASDTSSRSSEHETASNMLQSYSMGQPEGFEQLPSALPESLLDAAVPSITPSAHRCKAVFCMQITACIALQRLSAFLSLKEDAEL